MTSRLAGLDRAGLRFDLGEPRPGAATVTLSRPARRTVSCTGVAALQPGVGGPEQPCAAIACLTLEMLAERPSAARMRSPGRKAALAGAPFSTSSTEVVVATVCTAGSNLSSRMFPRTLPLSSTAANSTNAIRMFTPGPARITATRFHGGCE